LKIREQTLDSSGIGNSVNNIGLIYKDLEEYDKALEYLEACYDIKLKANLEFETSNVLNNIAIIWSTKGDLEKSKSYLLKGLAISQENNSDHITAMIFDNLGANYQKKGILDSAEFYFVKSFELAKKVEGKYWESSALLHLGELMLIKGEKKKAKDYTLQAYDIAKQTGYPERLRDISEQLYKIYLNEKDWENALKFQSEFILMRDSIINIDNKSQLIKYDYEKKTLADSLINIETQNILNSKIDKQNALVRSVKKDQEQNFILTIVAVVILFLIVLSLLRINAIRKKSNNALSDKNMQISKTSRALQIALEERNTLLKEIHHRVKNNLQTVSSLLSLQSRYLDDPNASKVLEESRNRLNSISLLHQKLYQNDNLPVVVLSEYINDLTSQIQETCEPHGKSIALVLHCDELTCDIEQAMPIGLILNELMTNSYKYAFGERNEGVIQIEFTNIEDDNYQLKVSDDGVGVPEDFSLKTGNSMGLNLVSLLTRQLKGSFEAKNNNGAQFIINFKMKNKHL
jgi:two-component sensor histidine kinase